LSEIIILKFMVYRVNPQSKDLDQLNDASLCSNSIYMVFFLNQIFNALIF
jgi:hypothetical protein